MAPIDVLAAVRRASAGRFHKNLSPQRDIRLQIVSDSNEALNMLADKDRHFDVLVVENQLGGVYELIDELRHSYPRLFIILVDEEADFGMPGQADDISTEPFENDDLVKRITKLMSDRQLETLRADSLPAVRDFAKRLRKAVGEGGKQQAAVSACKDLNYHYVAFYRLESAAPLKLTLKAQDGPLPIQSIAPKQAAADDLMAWVAQNGQSRIAGPGEDPNHPFVKRGRLGAVACVPVSVTGGRYGVLVACREHPGSIDQEHIMMLELVTAQLAAAVSKEIIG